VQNNKGATTTSKVNKAKDSVKSGTLRTRTYSFDHAQQVHYPSNPQQPGPIYLKVPSVEYLVCAMKEIAPKQTTLLTKHNHVEKEQILL